MSILTYRPRRLRGSENIRRMVRETTLDKNDFILPFFVTHGKHIRKEIGSMPGITRFSIDELLKEIKEVWSLGIPAVLLFGLPKYKDELGTEAYASDGIIQQAVRAVKDKFPDLLVVTDVCLCEYTSHGHCGVIEGQKILNDPTLELLAKAALSHAQAGADIVAPSDMMDGRIGAIRNILDENGYYDFPIMAYSAKYASSFYGPFREAADSAPSFGDRKTYQMDPANSDEALKEIAIDIDEGADIVMVKPALAFLDVIYRAKQEFGIPLAAYSVSGEFAMIKAAAKMGWIEEEKVMMEVLYSIKRAGADIIISYFAKEAIKILSKGKA